MAFFGKHYGTVHCITSFIYFFWMSCADIEESLSAYQIEYLNALWRVPRCQNLFRPLFFFCNRIIFPSHQTTVQCRSHNNNPSWDMESLVKYNTLGHKRAVSSIQSQGCFKLFPYHNTLQQQDRMCAAFVQRPYLGNILNISQSW